mgnify:CR=1 FL=1
MHHRAASFDVKSTETNGIKAREKNVIENITNFFAVVEPKPYLTRIDSKYFAIRAPHMMIH